MTSAVFTVKSEQFFSGMSISVNHHYFIQVRNGSFLSRPVPDSVSAPCLSPCAPYARTPKDLRMFVSRFVKSLLYVLPI